MYQDSWNGGLIKKGSRECQARYQVVRAFCDEQFGQDCFYVLEIGAAQGYFATRLTEDFSKCTVQAFEPRLPSPSVERVVWIRRKLSLKEAGLYPAGSFDLVLALSVLHHMREPFPEWIDALRRIGRNVILELAVDDSRSSPRMAKCEVPAGSKVIGYGASHIKRGSSRPIVLLQ